MNVGHKHRRMVLLALLLTATLLLALMGCGKEETQADSKDRTTSTTSGEGVSTTTADTTTTTQSDATTTEDAPDDTTALTTTTVESTTATTTAKPTTTKQSTTTVITTKPTTVLAQVPAELSGTKIKMMTWQNVTAADTAKATAFKDATGILVSYETVEKDTYQSNLTAKVMANNAPAMAAIINEWYPLPITRGLMQPIKNTGWDYSDPIYATAMMDQFAYKGERYGIALKGSAKVNLQVMFFNKKTMQSFGVTKDPYELWKDGQWNWDTCIEVAQKCTNAKQDKYGLTTMTFNYWMLSAGQDFVLSDANGLVNNMKSTQLLESWYHAWDMIYKHKVVPTYFIQQQNIFYNGSVAMLGADSSYMLTGSDGVPDHMTDEWGVVPFPSPKGQSAVSACEGVVWGFPTKVSGKPLQAAMWYLRYYLDDGANASQDLYPQEDCFEVLNWMWNQPIQSFNSYATITYSGKHSANFMMTGLVDETYIRARVKAELESWYEDTQASIDAIQAESVV